MSLTHRAARNSVPGDGISTVDQVSPASSQPVREKTVDVIDRPRTKMGCLPLHIAQEGESYRRWFNPWKFLKICMRSSSKVSGAVNVLWPFVPAAIVYGFAYKDQKLVVFTLNYIAMVPAANLLGFAGQELARKLPKVFGVVLETTLASCVELILMLVLLVKNRILVVQAAILGSILANLLLCLGACFFAGGLLRETQKFHESVSEVGSGLLLVAGFGLLIPSAFYTALKGETAESTMSGRYTSFTLADLDSFTLKISRATSVILLVAYLVFIWFQFRTHHSIIQELLEQDEHRDADKHKDAMKEKLTMTEAIVAMAIALTCVTIHAIFLVINIEYIVEEHGVSDNFLGLILVPLVEKAAEHLTAVDEAWDNQMNFALSHVLGSTIQTALLVAPIVVLVGWGTHRDMDLNFEIFMVVLLVLSILVVGNFLRDGESNYLEGALCMLVYVIIAVTTWYYPNGTEAATNGARHIEEGSGEGNGGGESNTEGSHAATTALTSMAVEATAHVVRRFMA